MRREARLAAAVVVCLLASAGALARPSPVAKGSEVSFVARITGSSFVAHSDALSGAVEYDAAARLLRHADLVVKADTITSGMGVRDDHMRDKYLEASRFPEIRFAAHEARLEPRAGAKGVVDGVFTIKGTQHPAKVEVTVDSVDGERMVVSAQFKLNVTDFGIPQPTFTVVKMDPVIDVTVKMVVAQAR